MNLTIKGFQDPETREKYIKNLLMYTHTFGGKNELYECDGFYLKASCPEEAVVLMIIYGFRDLGETVDIFTGPFDVTEKDSLPIETYVREMVHIQEDMIYPVREATIIRRDYIIDPHKKFRIPS